MTAHLPYQLALLLAADKLESGEWQWSNKGPSFGTIHYVNGQPITSVHCILTANGTARTELMGTRADLDNRGMSALRKVTGQEFVSAWNDRPERTLAEVVAALRAAAKVQL